MRFPALGYRDWRVGITMKLLLMPIYTLYPGDYRSWAETVGEAVPRASSRGRVEFAAAAHWLDTLMRLDERHGSELLQMVAHPEWPLPRAASHCRLRSYSQTSVTLSSTVA
jgi:hypothetical protein